MIVEAIDAALTALFWLPAKMLGYKKCSRCTIRYRRLQFAVWATQPLRHWLWLDHHRINWELHMLWFEADRRSGMLTSIGIIDPERGGAFGFSPYEEFRHDQSVD